MEEPIPGALDDGMWGEVPDDRAIAMAAGLAQAGSRSHVLLAACRETEVALEENGRGAFTQALLSTLCSVATDKVTYQDVQDRHPEIPKSVAILSLYVRLLISAQTGSTVRGPQRRPRPFQRAFAK